MKETLGPAEAGTSAGRPAAGAASEDVSFRNALLQSLARVAELQSETDRAAGESERGTGGDVEEVLAAVRKAQEAFDTLMQVRSRILTAFEEIQKVRT
ncbi:MAG: flagellar hook-basal body complex protein FliE [Planctomycetes bacterium]|nr:flagellar hook-basal body complex protein FliE [Planctomycetota bacterium]